MANEFVARKGIVSLGNIQVSGSISATGAITITGSIASASFAATASSADNFVVRQNLTGSNVLATGTITAQTLVVQTVTSSIVYTSGSNIFGNLPSNVQQFTGSLRVTGSGNHYIVGGNVGIGITTPRSLVEIQKVSGNTCIGATSNATLTLSQAGAINEISQIGLGYTLLSSPAVVGYITTNAADYTNGSLIFATRNVTTDTAPTERMRITSAGNVGIGTCTPCSILHIQGAAGSTKLTMLPPSGQPNIIEFLTNAGAVDARIKNESTQLQFETGTSGVPRMIFTSTGIACFACSVYAPNGIFSADFVQNETSKVGISFASGYAQINSWGANTTTYGGIKLQLSVSNGGTFSALTIAPTGAATFSSSVTAGSVLVDTLSLGTDGTYGGTYKTLGFTGNTNGSHRIFAGTSDDLYIASATGRGIRFWTNGSSGNVMTITCGNNVGIGTASPSYLLTLVQSTSGNMMYIGQAPTNTSSLNATILLQSGTIPQSGGDQTGEAGLIFNHSYGTGGVNGNACGGYIKSIRTNPFGVTSDVCTALVFATANGNVNNERMRITSTGVVGINDTNPSLSVASCGLVVKNASYVQMAVKSTNSSAGIEFIPGNGTSGYNWEVQASTSCQFFIYDRTNNVYRMTVFGSGVVCFSSTICSPCFATISDYRMKSNLRPIEGLSIIMNTKPYKFDYNYDCSTSFGMIAHELQEVLPEAVFGVKDGEVMQGVDYMKLLPITIKALQEQQCQICTQSTIIDQLKTCLGII